RHRRSSSCTAGRGRVVKAVAANSSTLTAKQQRNRGRTNQGNTDRATAETNYSQRASTSTSVHADCVHGAKKQRDNTDGAKSRNNGGGTKQNEIWQERGQ